MKKIINFLSSWGIFSTVLMISSYNFNDIRYYLPTLIIMILLIIRDSTKGNKNEET